LNPPPAGSSGGFATNDAGDPSCAATVAKTQKGKVDIIFVIDDSGSMTEEMNQIKANVNAFASKIGGVGLDYTVTFIVKRAMSPADTGNVICVPPPLAAADCQDNPPRFHHVDHDVLSHNSLDLILTTYEPVWRDYLRMEATKVFIEVSDDESDLDSDVFDVALLAKSPAGMFGTAAARNYIFHSIISKPFASKAPTREICPSSAGTSFQYQELSLLTNGIMDEVCKTDYSTVLDNIAGGIVDRLCMRAHLPEVGRGRPDEARRHVHAEQGARTGPHPGHRRDEVPGRRECLVLRRPRESEEDHSLPGDVRDGASLGGSDARSARRLQDRFAPLKTRKGSFRRGRA
jgi:hypothetical protein